VSKSISAESISALMHEAFEAWQIDASDLVRMLRAASTVERRQQAARLRGVSQTQSKRKGRPLALVSGKPKQFFCGCSLKTPGSCECIKSLEILWVRQSLKLLCVMLEKA
jgi:hypothetical protein